VKANLIKSNKSSFLTGFFVSLIGSLTLVVTPPVLAVNSNAQQCQNNLLYRDITPSQRLTTLGHEGEAVLLSEHYCIGFVGDIQQQHMAIKLTLTEALNISSRYNLVWSRLQQIEEKTAFAHLFVKQLSRKQLVLPSAMNENALTVSIPAKTPNGNIIKVSHNLTVSVQDHLVVYEGLHHLAMLADDTDYLRTWSDLDVLVKWAIKGNGDPNSYFADNGVSTVIDIGGVCSIERCKDRSGTDIWDDLENERDFCNMYDECFARIYWNIDYEENCIRIIYHDGTVVDGLSCEPKP
jgi:hypothetical protein